MSLFRVWYFDSNDRDEIARFKADEFEDVQAYLLKHFIKEGQQEKVEETYNGLEWNEFTPDDCRDQHIADDKCDACIYGPHHGTRCKKSNLECEAFECDEDYNPCDSCDGCSAGFSIEEVSNPDGVSWGETFEFKTIQGTNEYYDLTKRKILEESLKQLKEQHERLEKKWEADVEFCGPAAPNQSLNRCNANILTVEKLLATEVEKADDWDKTLSSAWKKSPEHGVAALLLNPITPQEGLSNELKERSKKKMEELK